MYALSEEESQFIVYQLFGREVENFSDLTEQEQKKYNEYVVMLESTELLPSESFEQSTLGHYYDALIRMDFSKFLKRNSDIEKYYSYLSELAYVFFQ